MARQDRVLDLARILHDRDHPLLAQLLVDGEPDDVERAEQLLGVVSGALDVEGQHVLTVRHRDGGELVAGAELALEVLVEALVVALHDHQAGVEELTERRVGAPHPEPDGRLVGGAEALDQLVAAVGVDVDAAAGDPEIVGEVGGEELGGVVDDLQGGRAEGDGLEGVLDAVEQRDGTVRHGRIMSPPAWVRKRVVTSE